MMDLEKVIEDSVWEKEQLAFWMANSLYINRAARDGLVVDKIQLVRATLPFTYDFQRRGKTTIGNSKDIIPGHVHYSDGSITILVSIGLNMEKEYETQVQLFNALNNSHLNTEVLEPERSYDRLVDEWYDRVKKRTSNVQTLILQGVENFARTLRIKVHQDPYTPFAYDRDSLFIGWTRGPQIGEVAKRFFSENDIQRCFIYGACGLFNEEAQIGDLYIPNSAVRRGEAPIRFHNIFDDYRINHQTGKIHHGGMLNVFSPHTETKSELKEATFRGFFGVEMELYALLKVMRESGNDMNLGAIYYCSDTPLKDNDVQLNSRLEYELVNCVINVMNDT
jgi:hypothetical protein